MSNDRKNVEKLDFVPLPASGHDSEPALEKGVELSGSEQIVGIGALCDFTDRPTIGDPTVHFRVTERCQLDSGSTVEIRDTGFNLSTTRHTTNIVPDPDPTAGLTLEFLTQEVLTLTGPEVRSNGSISEENHDWDELALCAQDAGLKITGDQLKALGYSITFTDRVRQHFPSQ